MVEGPLFEEGPSSHPQPQLSLRTSQGPPKGLVQGKETVFWGYLLSYYCRRPHPGGLAGQGSPCDRPTASGTRVRVEVRVLCLGPADREPGTAPQEPDGMTSSSSASFLTTAAGSFASQFVPSGSAKIGTTYVHTCTNSSVSRTSSSLPACAH